MKTDTRQIRKIHRALAIVFSASLLASAGSGVLHNVMSRTQPPPPKARPAAKVDPLAIKIPVAEAYSKLGLKEEACDLISVRMISGLPWYQFLIHGKEKPSYVNAVTGEVDDAADERYAGQIASDRLGGAAVRKTDYLTEFDSEYINIFRILPVYRFDADDVGHTRVYVSTMTGSVTRDTNDRKQFEASVFSNVHKFMFIKNKDLRDLALTFMTSGVFVVGVLGIALFFLARKNPTKP